MTAARTALIGAAALLIVGCGGHKAESTGKSDRYRWVIDNSCVGSGVPTVGGTNYKCSAEHDQVPRPRAAVAEIKRYLSRHPVRSGLYALSCGRSREAINCTVTFDRGCEVLAVRGPSNDPWVVPGSGHCRYLGLGTPTRTP